MCCQVECRILVVIKVVIKVNGFDLDGIVLDGSGRVFYGIINLVIWLLKILLNFEWNDLVEYLVGLVKIQILLSYVKMFGYMFMDF